MVADNDVEFVWGHNASSLCVGYMSTDHQKPKVIAQQYCVTEYI